MSPSDRRPKKVDRRRVAEVAGQTLRDSLGEPDAGSFAEGVEAHLAYRKRMCPETEVGCGWGDYVEEPDGKSQGAPVGGRTELVRFPRFWSEWFDAMSPAKLAALNAMATREVERGIIVKAWRSTWKIAIGAALASAAGMRWFTAQAEWIIEKIPVLRGFWKLLTGGMP